FFHPRQLDDGAMLAQGLAQPLEALAILQLHAAHVGGNVDVVGDENQQRIRIGVLEVIGQRLELIVLLAAAVQRLDVAQEEDLEGRHQRGSAGVVEDLLQWRLCQIEFVQAEIAQRAGDQVLQDGVAAAAAKKTFVAYQHVGGAQLVRRNVGGKAVGGVERSHCD